MLRLSTLINSAFEERISFCFDFTDPNPWIKLKLEPAELEIFFLSFSGASAIALVWWNTKPAQSFQPLEVSFYNKKKGYPNSRREYY